METFKTFKDLSEQLGLFSGDGDFIKDLIKDFIKDFIKDSIGKIRHFTISLDQMNNLKRKREELNGQKEDATAKIKTEIRPWKRTKEEFDQWLDRVESVNVDIELLVVSSLETQVGVRGFLSRGSLQKDVCKKIKEVEELLQKGRYSDGLVIDDPSRLGQRLSTPTLAAGTMALIKRDEVLGYLMNGDTHKIGIHGMPGMGKTTVSKLVNNELLNKSDRFDFVVWLSVSKNWSIFDLQNKIAQAMHIVIGEDEGETRAGKLSETLIQKGRFVLILDDVWDNFSLVEVGIPEPSIGNGSKLVLTTRSSDVCRQMGCQEVKMEPLPEADAWRLFLDKVGQSPRSSADIAPVAKSVAAHCAGLPLAIIIVAGSMRGEYSLPIWRNALNELEKNMKSVNGGDFKDRVIHQLKFSYECLNDWKVQKCFLISETYGEESGIHKMQLIDKWIEGGFVDDMGNTQANRDIGQAILKNLVDNCLLEYVGNDRVKMHDLVRDMAKMIIRELDAS